ncbi:hypothetical protein CLPU_3c03260 [Gottschalkia purinilytica]|uniref:Uncharacterized protein n=1 Tax=Gottschalkia purinilytica TaxID=1503 RepID=A0A0L0WDM8_GOTPU|nr:hypothetical protein [Gottschalkia purinilytica]KNF09546.1 hypothetical protein CLPU_3c03260 [Gottschalkia purinilytica]
MGKETNKDNDQFTKLSNEELLNDIKETNRSQLSNIGLMAYVELFNRNVYLRTILKEEQDLLKDMLNDEKSFKELYDKCHSSFIGLEQASNLKDSEEINIDELKELRRDIVKLLKGLSAYSTEISYSNEIAKDMIYKNFIKENETDLDKNLDYRKFYQSVNAFIIEDPNMIKNKVMDITSILPVRVSKQKYYDIISKAFIRNLSKGSKKRTDVVLNRYKTLFNGSLEAEYGLYFSKYFRKAQEARQIQFEKASQEELKEIYNDTFNTMSEINKVSNIIRELGVIVNRIIAIAMLKESILSEIEEYPINSLVSSWKSYIKDENNRSKVIENYKKLFEALDKKFKETNIKLQKLTLENFNRKNKIDDNLKEELLKTQYVLDYINDYALEQEEILPSDYEDAVDKEYLEQAVKSLIQFIDRNIKDMSNSQRRIRMKRLLALTEMAFASPQEFFEYFANSIDMISSKEELLSTMNSILELMNFYRNSKNTVKH